MNVTNIAGGKLNQKFTPYFTLKGSTIKKP